MVSYSEEQPTWFDHGRWTVSQYKIKISNDFPLGLLSVIRVIFNVILLFTLIK